MKSTKFGNEKGFSVVEVLTACALVIVTSLVLSSIFNSFFKSTTYSDAKVRELELIHNIRLSLYNQGVCDNIFKGQTFNSGGALELAQLKDAIGKTLLVQGEKVEGFNNLRTVSIVLRTPTNIWSAYQSAKSSLPAEGYFLTADFQLTFERPRGTVSSQTHTSTLRVPVNVNGSGVITQCITAETGLTDALTISATCSQLGGTYDTSAGKCEFNKNCDALDPTKPVDSSCLEKKIASIKSSLKSLPSKSVVLDFSLQNEMLNCFRSPGKLTIGANSVSCKDGRSDFVVSPSTLDFTSARVSYNVNDPAIAREAYNRARELISIIFTDRK